MTHCYESPGSGCSSLPSLRPHATSRWQAALAIAVSVHFVCLCGQAVAALLAAILAVEGAILEFFFGWATYVG